jgi:hypothetical protein
MAYSSIPFKKVHKQKSPGESRIRQGLDFFISQNELRNIQSQTNRMFVSAAAGFDYSRVSISWLHYNQCKGIVNR